MLKTMMGALGIAACACMLAVASPGTEKATAKPATETGLRSSWPAETLSGKILMVDPAKDLLVVTGPHGVPFDMSVKASTTIEASGHKLTLSDLKNDQQKDVSVRFVPERAGDIARTIQVTG